MTCTLTSERNRLQTGQPVLENCMCASQEELSKLSGDAACHIVLCMPHGCNLPLYRASQLTCAPAPGAAAVECR